MEDETQKELEEVIYPPNIKLSPQPYILVDYTDAVVIVLLD